MENSENKKHWEEIHKKKGTEEATWFQPHPTLSLKWIEGSGADLSDPIIDIGGGDSRLAECLLDKGFSNITVLDISESGLQKAKERMGPDKAQRIGWIISDIMDFDPDPIYEVWHDRATFHFLSTEEERNIYVQKAAGGVRHAGNLIIGSFGPNGPEKCSDLPVQRHDEQSLKATFEPHFYFLSSEIEMHQTPDGQEQEFIFAKFRKK